MIGSTIPLNPDHAAAIADLTGATGRAVQRWFAAASATKRPARTPLKLVAANDQ